MNHAVVLLSGGLDSTTLLHYVRQRAGAGVYALTFCYGQRHVREIAAARWQAARAGVLEHRVADLDVFPSLIPGASALTDPRIAMPALADLDPASRRQPPTYVPHRNLILLALAAAFAEARGVSALYYGAQRQDAYGYWDCTPEFQTRLNAVLALNRGTAVTVQAPFATMRKTELVRLGLELGVDYEHTWTCYRGDDRPCGACPACEERATAFREAGIPDPLLDGEAERFAQTGSSQMDDKQTETLIVKALGDTQWEYRTAEGIAAETGLDRTVVANFIESRKDIAWKSAIPDKQGRDLFTLNTRHSQGKEFWRNLSTFMSKLSA